MNNQTTHKCPRCDQAPMRAWHELTDEEREVVRRLPRAAEYSDAERKAMHRWCPRCWYEAKSTSIDT